MSQTRLNIQQLHTQTNSDLATDNEVDSKFLNHKNENNPHSQYLQITDAQLLYAQLNHTHNDLVNTSAIFNRLSKTNSLNQIIYFGQPVYSINDSSISLGVSNDILKKNIIGLVCDNSISVNGSGFIQTNGIIEGTIAQWELVTNSIGGLIAGKVYYLDTTLGRITHTATMAENTYICRLGFSVSATQLSIKIDNPMLL